MQGLLNSVLLPVAVIAFVLLILKLSIDPAGPKLQLSFDIYNSSNQPDKRIPIFVGGNSSSLTLLVKNSCMELEPRTSVRTSLDMSDDLLLSHDTAKYGKFECSSFTWIMRQFSEIIVDVHDVMPFVTSAGALVFNDTILSRYNFSALNQLNTSVITPGYGPSVTHARIPDAAGDVPSSVLIPGVSGGGLLVPLTILHNTSSDHAMPVFIQELAQAQLRTILQRPAAYLKAYSQPLPLTKDEALEIQTALTVLAALFVLIPFCYLAATFAVFVVRERSVKAKLLQV